MGYPGDGSACILLCSFPTLQAEILPESSPVPCPWGQECLSGMDTGRRAGQAHLQEPGVLFSTRVDAGCSHLMCSCCFPVLYALPTPLWGKLDILVFTYMVQSSEAPAHPPALGQSLAGALKSKRLPQPKSFLVDHWSQINRCGFPILAYTETSWYDL